MRAVTEQKTEDLWELMGKRGHSLILVSNRSPQDWHPLFLNPVRGESLLDRLIRNAHHLVFAGRSHRPLRRPDRPEPETPCHQMHRQPSRGSHPEREPRQGRVLPLSAPVALPP